MLASSAEGPIFPGNKSTPDNSKMAMTPDLRVNARILLDGQVVRQEDDLRVGDSKIRSEQSRSAHWVITGWEQFMTKVISPSDVASELSELWCPRIIGVVDDSYVKVARIKGSFTWHSHDDQDEMFFVLQGHMQIEMEHETVELDAGDMYIVPKGVRHHPNAEKECHILIFERKSTLHTGELVTERTRSIEEQMG